MHFPGSRSDARLNRERLLVAAREVFGERGLAAEVKDIADRAGLGVGTLYRNFATKDDLVHALVGEVQARFEEALTAAEALPRATDGLLHLFTTGWSLVEEHGALMVGLIDAGYGHDEARPELLERAKALIHRGVDEGEVRADVPVAFIGDFLDMSMPFVYLHLRAHWNAEDAGRYCSRLLMSAIASRPWTEL